MNMSSNKISKTTQKIAEKHLEKCNNKKCKFSCGGKKCCFGLRNSAGCYMTNPEKMEEHMNNVYNLRMQYEIRSRTGDKESADILKQLETKQFTFVFKGHEYTVNDSARNQSECPHCGNQTGDGSIWSIESEAYIGVYVNKKDIMRCFECPKCFEKFFYHDVR
jgi:hypothetical protein